MGMILLAMGTSRAQWRATGPGPFRYDDTANWKGWLVNDQLTNNPGAEQTIVFTTDRTMPKGLTIKQPKDASGAQYSLRFKARNAKDSAGESRTLMLRGPMIVDFGRTKDITAFFGENDPINFDFGNSPAVFEMLTGNSHAEIKGSILNARGLIIKGGGMVVGGGRLTLSGKDSNVTGLVVLEEANLYLIGAASLPRIEAISLSGYSTLALQNETTSLLDQLPESVPISCSGRAQIRLYGGANNPSEETLGKIFLKENCLEVWVSAKQGRSAVLTNRRL